MASEVYNNEQIVIKDACILFDLIDLNLLEVFFQLNVTAYTTSHVLEEIQEISQRTQIIKHIENNQLIIDDKGEYDTIESLFNQYPALSIADSSVLEFALRKRAVIVSSDGALRRISTANKLEIRGLLWIIEELYAYGIITQLTVIEKLQQYTQINSRSPQREIQKLIAKYQIYP